MDGRVKEDKGMREEIAELLECALINCDNIPKIGIAGVEIVKMQIQDAIDLLEENKGA